MTEVIENNIIPNMEIIIPNQISSNSLILADAEQPNPLTKEIVDDIEFAKENLRHLIETGQNALEKVMNLGTQINNNMRAYESVPEMLKAISELSDKLINMSRIKKDVIEGEATPTSLSQNIINNNILITPTELLRKLKEADLVEDKSNV